MGIHKPSLAIVTGAASGLGRAFCRQLAVNRSVHVVLADVDEAGAEETLAQMQSAAPTAAGQFVRLDVTNETEWRGLSQRLEAEIDANQFSGVKLLINNAGVCTAGEVIEQNVVQDSDPWRRTMEVNYFGTLHGCRTIAPLMLRRPELRPGIVNISSIAGVVSAPAMGAYAASKAAVLSLSETLYAELQAKGVRVTAVAPGFFRSQLVASGEFADDLHRSHAQAFMDAATIDADAVARAALTASDAARLYVVVGGQAPLLWRWKRFAPRTLLRAMGRRYRRMMADESGGS